MECDEGYRRVDSRCAEDQEVSLYADHLASIVARVLRDRAGRVECGESVQHVLTSMDLREMLVPDKEGTNPSDASRKSRRRRAGRFDSEKFGAAFARALVLLETASAFGVGHSYGGYYALHPQLPLTCRARRFVFRNWRFFLAAVVSFVAYVYVSLRRQRENAKKLAILDACDSGRAILEEQAAVYREGRDAYDYVTDTHLRDEVLGNTRAAIQLWKEVEFELKRDTRVSLSGLENHQGHPCYKWRWLGRQSLLGSNSRRTSYGSTPGSAGRRSFGRSSLGSTPGSAPGSAGRSSLRPSPPGPSPPSAGFARGLLGRTPPPRR